jgi:hypothetical protein
MMQIDAANRLEDLHSLGSHLFANTVARDDRDSICHGRILAVSEAVNVACASGAGL